MDVVENGHPDLPQVVVDAAQGNLEAEQLLVNRFSRRLVRLAATRISEVFNSKIEPEDVVQSVFKSFFARHRRGSLDFTSWDDVWSFLACVTVRKCSEKANWFLRDKRNINRELSCAVGAENTHFQLASSEPSPDDVMMFEELLAELFGPLMSTQREIVRLRMEGFTNTEIAEKLGRTERTVYRALEQLRESVEILFDRYLKDR